MTSTLIDRDSRSTIAAAEAQAALMAGDTKLAREKYGEAGMFLADDAVRARGTDEEHLALFLAATQFYKGGHYPKAQELARRIKAAKLPEGIRELFSRFKQNVSERAAADYPNRFASRLRQMAEIQDWDGIIELLQEDPYHLSPADLAFNRGLCCEALRKYRAAVLFFADAAQRDPHDPGMLAALIQMPIHAFAGRGDLVAAREYVQTQVQLYPNAVSHALASLFTYQQLRQSSDEATRSTLLRQQLWHFDEARKQFGNLAITHQRHPEIKAVVGLGYEAATLSLFRTGDLKGARAMCDEAIAFDPDSPTNWTSLGVITIGEPEAPQAFRKAVDLGDKTYFPYYYLAYDALAQGHWQESLQWSRQALEYGDSQDSTIKSLLYQWGAIALIHQGGSHDEVERLFQMAREVAPDNQTAQENYERFLASATPEPPVLVRRVPDDEIIRGRASLIPLTHNNADLPGRLAPVAC